MCFWEETKGAPEVGTSHEGRCCTAGFKGRGQDQALGNDTVPEPLKQGKKYFK